jgi:2'-5' RNA ligase
VFSLNVPVPGEVARVAGDLRPSLVDAGVDRFRDRHSLVVKRFEGADDGAESLPRLRERLRPVLRGQPAFEARVGAVDAFTDPPRGPGPVVYLAVESPGLGALHDRLVDRFGAVAGLEGDDYTPHVTLGRGGSVDAATLAALSRRVDPVTWTVSELVVYDSRHREAASRLSLPA